MAERIVHHAVGNYEPPTCPRCGRPAISDNDHHALIEPWLYDRVEASVRCVACGRSTLADEFVAGLGAVMGPRTRMVVERV